MDVLPVPPTVITGSLDFPRGRSVLFGSNRIGGPRDCLREEMENRGLVAILHSKISSDLY